MKRARFVLRLCLVVVGIAAVATPVAAQSVNRAAIDELNTQLLYVALPLTLFVEITLLNAIYRFRDNDDPSPTVDDRALELTWNAATAVILVFVGVSAYFVMSNVYLTPAAADAGSDEFEPDIEINVTAYQWGWEFEYADTGITTGQQLVIPEGQDIQFRLSSRDVLHSFYIPKLGVKQDLFPRSTQIARTRATATGTHRLYCAELCGDGHSRMQADVVVLNQSEYQDWVDRKQSEQ